MLEGKKVILRSFKTEDIENTYSLIINMNVRNLSNISYIVPFSLALQKEFVENTMKYSGPLFRFAIEEKKSRNCIGACGVNGYDEKNRNMSIGLWIGEEYQGNGYGSDALRVLCDYIFSEMNIHKIKLQYFSFNEKAKICYEKVGFKIEGIQRKEFFRFGKYHDIILMGLFCEDLLL